MPEMDGIEVCHRLRENKEIDNTIIAMLTARNEDYTQVAGLQAGADDFIKKPIKPRLLVTKVESLLRRGAQNNHSVNDNKSAIVIDRERLVLKKGKRSPCQKKNSNYYFFYHQFLSVYLPEMKFTVRYGEVSYCWRSTN